MFASILFVAIGIVLLILGGELLLRGAVGLATRLRLTPAVIGLTVVAAGTSVPELAVSAVAAWRGDSEIAVANVVGSNIFNICAILGLAAVFRPLAISGNTIKLEYPVLALVTLLSLAIMEDNRVSRLDGIAFIAIYVGFTAYLVSLVRQQMNPQEAGGFRSEVAELNQTVLLPLSLFRALLLITIGVTLLGFGAQSTVAGATRLAEMLGISKTVIGLTIVAAGTGLPEVVTSLVSSFRGRDDVAIGNVIGSNLFNVLGILGLTAIVRPVPVAAAIMASDAWWMLAVTALLFPLMYSGLRINRWEGLGLLSVYVGYVGQLLWRLPTDTAP